MEDLLLFVKGTKIQSKFQKEEHDLENNRKKYFGVHGDVSIFELCIGFMENNSSVTLSGQLREVKKSPSFFVWIYM